MTREQVLLLEFVRASGRESLTAAFLSRGERLGLAATGATSVLLAACVASAGLGWLSLLVLVPVTVLGVLLPVDPDRPLHTLLHVSASGFYLRGEGGEFADARDAVATLGADRLVRVLRRALTHHDPAAAAGLVAERAQVAQEKATKARADTDELAHLVRAEQDAGQVSLARDAGELCVSR